MYTLTDPVTIRRLLARYGFRFSKSLGQNFLVDPGVCPEMVRLSGASADTGVLEIGPGLGVLTAELARKADKVVAVELDQKLIPLLRETLGEFPNVSVINADILKIDLAALIREELGGREAVICANLPYYITSPVLMRLLEERPGIRSITVMVQKEAAERFCCEPGTRECGAVTLAVHYYARPHVLFEVPAGSFMPRPKVDSCVIRLDIRKEPPVHPASEKLFFRVIRASFEKRRKTIANALSSGLAMEKAEILRALAQAEIPAAARGENLTLQEYARLSDAVLLRAGEQGISLPGA